MEKREVRASVPHKQNRKSHNTTERKRGALPSTLKEATEEPENTKEENSSGLDPNCACVCTLCACVCQWFSSFVML